MHEDDEWLELFDNLPTLVADELEAFNDAKWSIQSYFNAKPDRHDIALLETRVNAKAVVERIAHGTPLDKRQSEALALIIAGIGRKEHAPHEVEALRRRLQREMPAVFGRRAEDKVTFTTVCVDAISGFRI